MKPYCYTPQSFTKHLFILTTLIGTSTAYAEQIIITDGRSGHVIDGQSVGRIDVWNKGTGVDIKNTTANGSVTYVNGPQGNIENTTINCTTSGCSGLMVQGTQTIATSVTGDGINISAMGDGLYITGSSSVDLTNVTISSGSHGLDLNGSVAGKDFANMTKIDGFDITAGKYGVYAMFGSQVELSNGTITTTADKGIGIYLGGANYRGDEPLQTTAKMNNVTVHTKGNNAYGVYSAQMSGSNGGPNRGAVSLWDHSNIITEGDGSSGIIGSYSWNTITLTNGSTVMTSGNNDLPTF
ncbi:hypothetical protein [Orbus mooreae]|uniref:hypothetical protein n=1 Tax=Orbus mooreae TaxID=3074107 RepID=UPI00370D20B7